MKKAINIILTALCVLSIGFSVKAQQQADSTCIDSSSLQGSLTVHIENAVEEDIIGATALVLQGEKQITGGVIDISGFLHLSGIEPGAYQVVVSGVNTGRQEFEVTIASDSTSAIVFRANTITELDAIVVDELDPRRGCRNEESFQYEPFFDPYGQPKPKRGWLYCEMYSIDW